MKNKVLKIIFVLVILLMLVTNSVFAKSIIGQYGNKGDTDFSGEARNTADKFINRSIYITKMITLTVSIVMLILLGVKYVSASPGEKAEVKKHLTVYVIGAVVAFGAYGILEIVQQFATSL